MSRVRKWCWATAILFAIVCVVLLVKHLFWDLAMPGGLAPAGRGEPVSLASRYSPEGGPHPIALLTESGAFHPWNETIPGEWRSKSVRTTELVAMVRETSGQAELRYTPYTGRPSTGTSLAKVHALSYVTYIRVFEAATGRELATGAIKGAPPRLGTGAVRASRPAGPGDLVPTDGFTRTEVQGIEVHPIDGQPPKPEDALPFLKLFAERWFVGVLSGSHYGCFSPDGKWIVTARQASHGAEGARGGKADLKLWDTRTGAKLWEAGLPNGFEEVAFSRAGDLIATISDDECVRFWHTSNGQLARETRGPEGLRVAALSRDGATAASVWKDGSGDAQDDGLLKRHRRPTPASVQEEEIKRSTVVVWDTASGDVLRRVMPGFPSWVRFGANPRLLLCVSARDDGTGALTNVDTGVTSKFLKGGGRPLLVLPDGHRAILGPAVTHGRGLCLHDLEKAEVVLTYPESPEFPARACLSPDGQRLVAGGHGAGLMAVYDVETGKLVHEFPVDEVPLDVSADGRLLLSSGEDGNVRLWRMP